MVFKKTKTNMPSTTSRLEVPPEEEPPSSIPRDPDKDPTSIGVSKTKENTATSMPSSGDERHVTTIDSEAQDASPDPFTAGKDKSRLMSPQQSRQRETVLSPKKTKSAV